MHQNKNVQAFSYVFKHIFHVYAFCTICFTGYTLRTQSRSGASLAILRTQAPYMSFDSCHWYHSKPSQTRPEPKPIPGARIQIWILGSKFGSCNTFCVFVQNWPHRQGSYLAGVKFKYRLTTQANKIGMPEVR